MIATMSGELAILCLLALAIMAAAAGAAQAIVERAQEAERPRMVAAGRLGPARDELPHRRDDCAGAWQLDAADAVAWCDGCGARLSYDHDPAVLDLALADIRERGPDRPRPLPPRRPRQECRMNICVRPELLVPGARFGCVWRTGDRIEAATGGVPGTYQPRSARLVFVEVGRGRSELWYRTAHADSGDLLCSFCSCGGKT